MPRVRRFTRKMDANENGIFTPEEGSNKVMVKVDCFTTLLVDKDKLEKISKEAYIQNWLERKIN